MQSTVQTDICDAWANAIEEAEAEAEAREQALRDGRDPDVAARLMREGVREKRIDFVWQEIRYRTALSFSKLNKIFFGYFDPENMHR